jgi:hypothetical protein
MNPTPELLLSTFIQLVNASLPAADLAEVHNGTELDLFLDPNDLLAEAYETATGHAMNYRSTDEPLNQLLSQTFEAAAAKKYIPEAATAPKKDYTEEEWQQEGERRFGPDRLKWKFQCPACKNIQCAEDFRPYKAHGATAETAFRNCFGRFTPNPRRAFEETGPGPCDYTSGGLFNINPVKVTFPDTSTIQVFAFANA